jgi:hypothetical protein
MIKVQVKSCNKLIYIDFYYKMVKIKEIGKIAKIQIYQIIIYYLIIYVIEIGYCYR